MLRRARRGALDASKAGPFHPRQTTYDTSYVLNTTKWHSPEPHRRSCMRTQRTPLRQMVTRRIVAKPPRPSAPAVAASTPVSAGAVTVLKKCATAAQSCASDTATTKRRATSTWAAKKAVSPGRLQRRCTSPHHMPYNQNTTSSTNDVIHVWYHGPARIHGTRKKWTP